MMSTKFNMTPAPSNLSGSASVKSVIYKQVTVEPTMKLILKELKPDSNLDDEVLVYGVFKVDISGNYSISNQLCILQNSTDIGIACNYLQYGICEKKDSGCSYESCFNSVIINADVHYGYAMSQNLSTVLYLDSAKEYQCWVNLGSEDNTGFTYSKQHSRLSIYKL